MTLFYDRQIRTKNLKGTNKKFVYRTNSSDLLMFSESDYDSIDFQSTDVFMDIGANCGSNVVKYADRVKQIVCYECMADSFEVLQQNVAINQIENAELHLGAIAKEEGECNIFFNERAKNGHSAAGPIQKRTSKACHRVKSYSFLSEVKKWQPTIVKIDIEGGEFELLEDLIDSDLSSVRTLVLEVHLKVTKNSEEFIDSLQDRLTSFDCLRKDQPKLYGNLVCTLLFFTRKP